MLRWIESSAYQLRQQSWYNTFQFQWMFIASPQFTDQRQHCIPCSLLILLLWITYRFSYLLARSLNRKTKKKIEAKIHRLLFFLKWHWLFDGYTHNRGKKPTNNYKCLNKNRKAFQPKSFIFEKFHATCT